MKKLIFSLFFVLFATQSIAADLYSAYGYVQFVGLTTTASGTGASVVNTAVYNPVTKEGASCALSATELTATGEVVANPAFGGVVAKLSIAKGLAQMVRLTCRGSNSAIAAVNDF
jgi:hypothetical protein